MRVIGLTGGIASGKSTVAKILEKLGARVLDADQLSREAVIPCRPAYHAIVQAFGDGILHPDRTIDRKALGKIVFADPEARKRLEEITHPAIRSLAGEKLDELRREGNGIAFYMAPLLVEAGTNSRVDEIWVVFADWETQTERLVSRDGISRAEAMQRLAAQMPMEEKAKYGRVVIDNRGTQEELERQVREVWEREIGTAVNGER